MKTRSKSNHLVRRAGQQGTRPPGRKQPGIEKCATGVNTSEDDLPGNQNQDIPNPEPVVYHLTNLLKLKEHDGLKKSTKPF